LAGGAGGERTDRKKGFDGGRDLRDYRYFVCQLSENLGLPIQEVQAFPITELREWMWFFGEKERRRKAESGDLLSMDDPFEGLKSMGAID